jgi:hypothetical protein
MKYNLQTKIYCNLWMVSSKDKLIAKRIYEEDLYVNNI